MFVTAVTGAATFSGYFRSAIVHHALAIVSLVVNVLVALIEFRAISRNGQLIDGILARIATGEEKSATDVTPMNTDVRNGG